MLRYANEFNGVRLAGAIGYERITDIATPLVVNPLDVAFTGPRPDITAWGIALSAMHVPTGLFIQGHYNAVDYGNIAPGAPSGYWGQSAAGAKKDVAQWLIQAGVSRNWFGYGLTSVYGEYGVATDWGANQGLGRNYTTTGFNTVLGVTDTEMKVWGLGIAQTFDAAATVMYLGYRHMEADIACTGTQIGSNTVPNPNVVVACPGGRLPTEDIDVIVMGARVLF
jgi:hypothetical protein